MVVVAMMGGWEKAKIRYLKIAVTRDSGLISETTKDGAHTTDAPHGTIRHAALEQ